MEERQQGEALEQVEERQQELDLHPAVLLSAWEGQHRHDRAAY